MARSRLSDPDRARIAAAIAAAEARTRGELFCILAPDTSDYMETALAWAAAAALLIPPLALWAGLDFTQALSGGWDVAHARPGTSIGLYALAQVVVFAVVAAGVGWTPLRYALTPSAVKTAMVRRAARSHYISTGLAAAEDRTGVLIFAALAEHRVEILAHKEIDDAVGAGVWQAAATALAAGMKADDPAEGFVRAIGLCADALATHAPATGAETNDYPDQIVEL
jgi:putative membrane protein